MTPVPDFKTELVSIIPALRAFARSLCGNPALADDLVQETMLKAWTARDSYIVGTNFKAWTFRILRNAFYSTWRKSRRLTSIDEEHHAKTARALENVETAMGLAEVSSAIQQLPLEQREALILIAAGGFNYDEVAKISGVAVGTVKSRVSRGRSTLAVLMTKRNNQRKPTAALGAAAGLIWDADQLVKRAAATP